MKTKISKIVLPAFALLLAVSLSFATSEVKVLEIGYIQGPNGPIQVQVDCKSEIVDPCTYLGQPVYEDQDFTRAMTKSLP